MGVAAIGTIGIGATSADEAAGSEARAPSTARIAGVLGLLCLAALLDCFLRYRRASQDKRSLRTAKPSASSYGLQVGVNGMLTTLADHQQLGWAGGNHLHAPLLDSKAPAPRLTKQRHMQGIPVPCWVRRALMPFAVGMLGSSGLHLLWQAWH